ncbi:MAG TPA: hypothetical protein VKE26_22240 [Xanthobacteraceae bacterium]|nr:hypothetical protein [Xanthobacteraceae bacterium]
MKFDELRSISHNIADSLASGVGLLVGVYGTDIFKEVSGSPEGFITVNFLTGTSTGGKVSPLLASAICKYRDALPVLCRKHGASSTVFRELTARYSIDMAGSRRVVVTIENNKGRRSIDEYVGAPGRRVRVLDHLGRVRRK